LKTGDMCVFCADIKIVFREESPFPQLSK